MTPNDSKSYLPYLNNLVDKYNNTLLMKNLLMQVILRWLKKLKRIIKLLNFKLMMKSEAQIIRIFSVKVTLKIGKEKYLLLILF